VADLDGPRLVVANEPDAGRQWNESRIKQMTGGDNVKGRFMGQDWFEFTPQFKLVMIGNHKPRFRVVSYAMRRRIKLISFDVTIPPEEDDKSLLEKLKEELGGILQWMIDGCREWQRIGLSVPRAVKEATENYLDQEDTFGQWLNACCLRVAGAWTSTEDLISSWVIFAKAAGEDPGDEKHFREAMEGHGLDKKRTNSRRGYAGVTLKRSDTP
jgi:putative DNA primase/helicase